MTLIKWRSRNEWDPFKELFDIQGEMNKLFGRSFSKGMDSPRFVPALDIYEEKGKVVVRADIPGLQKEDIEVSVSDDVLTIKGEKKYEYEDKNKNYYKIERSYGTFERSVSLPSYLDKDKIEADYNEGVLEIKLQKSDKVKEAVKKIEIR